MRQLFRLARLDSLLFIEFGHYETSESVVCSIKPYSLAD